MVATNAARHRIAATADGRDVKLLEFGLRRAQGPDGGLSASRYAYVGGFDGTSNLLAGKLYDIPVKGTHAHSYVMSYDAPTNGENFLKLEHRTQQFVDTNFYGSCVRWRSRIARHLNANVDNAHDGELAAFASYACVFPETFVALVDTYDVVKSGLINFLAVSFALNDLHYQPQGVRIDSGDLAYLSR